MRSSLITLSKYLKPFSHYIVLIFIMLFFSAMADLYLPSLLAKIVNQGVVKADLAYIIHTGILMLVVAVTGVSCALVSSFNVARVVLGFSRSLRSALFSRVENYSLDTFDKIGTASLITRTTNDVNQLQRTLVMMLSMMVRAPIMGIGGMVMALMHDRVLSLVFFVTVPLLAVTVLTIASRGVPLFRLLQKKLDALNMVIREKLTGIRVIRAFDRVEYEKKRFDAANTDLNNTGLKLVALMNLIMPMMMIIMNFTVLAIVWFGSLRTGTGHIQVGDIMAFIQYAMQILFALMMISMMLVMLPRAQVSADRIDEVLALEPETERLIKPETKPEPSEPLIRFDHVSFLYHGAEAPALKDVSFSADAGEVTAIIGSTGSGKTTLINLLPRFYEATEGSVRINGRDAQSISRAELRRMIGLVPQKTILFTGSVRDNVRFGRNDATDEEVVQAADSAQALSFIREMKGGLDAVLAQGGTNLSGGQRQRLAIARVLCRKPRIYIFDDSFSALDFKTDAALRKALKAETREAAVLIIAQRVSTIMDADRIVVLDEGRVAGIGTHQALMRECGLYREIVYSQLSQEELS